MTNKRAVRVMERRYYCCVMTGVKQILTLLRHIVLQPRKNLYLHASFVPGCPRALTPRVIARLLAQPKQKVTLLYECRSDLSPLLHLLELSLEAIVLFLKGINLLVLFLDDVGTAAHVRVASIIVGHTRNLNKAN